MKCLYFRVTKTGAHLLQTFLNPGLLKSLSKPLTYKTISTKRIPEQNVYIGHSQTCKMLFLRKIVNGFLPSSGKSSILDVWQGSEYASVRNTTIYNYIESILVFIYYLSFSVRWEKVNYFCRLSHSILVP